MHILWRIYAFHINLIFNIFLNSNHVTLGKKNPQQHVRKSEWEVSFLKVEGEFGMIIQCW